MSRSQKDKALKKASKELTERLRQLNLHEPDFEETCQQVLGDLKAEKEDKDFQQLVRSEIHLVWENHRKYLELQKIKSQDDSVIIIEEKENPLNIQGDGWEQHLQDLNKTLRNLNVSDNTEVWTTPLEELFEEKNQRKDSSSGQDYHQKDNMATIEDLIRQLAQMQLANQHQQRPNQTTGEVLKICANVIIKFNKNNLNNFLESVEMALSLIPDEAANLTVLKYAKQRVEGSVAISSKEYATFEAFKADVLSTFKPKRTVTEIESMISRLMQKPDETVDQFGKRVSELKYDYELASQAERSAVNANLDAVRLAEMEAKVSRAFLNGLKDHIIKFVGEKPVTMSAAISTALEAESTSSLRFQNRKLAGNSTSGNSGNGNKKPDQKKFQTSGKNSQGTSSKNNKTEGEKKVPKCYNCGKTGHIKPKCPEMSQEDQAESLSKSKGNDSTKKSKNESGGASVSAKSLKISKQR